MKLPASAKRRFAEHALYLAQSEPGLGLNIDIESTHTSINGTIDVPVGGGRTQGFSIEVQYVGLSPFKLPKTRDPVGRFPPDVDRHVMPDGWFCMWIPHAAPTDFDTADGLALHLDRVREFIVLQLMYEDRLRRGRTPTWPGPAWGHGEKGHREWVRNQTAGLTAQVVAGLANAAINHRHSGSRCPCGSGRSFGQCHAGWVVVMRRALRTSKSVYEELKAIVEEGGVKPAR